MVMYLRINFCVVPENTHTHPKDSDLKFQGTEGSQKWNCIFKGKYEA